MKSVLLTAMFLGLAFSTAFADEAPKKLDSPFKVEMESYSVSAENVSSIDILVDYEMMSVNCHGLPFVYEATQSKDSNKIFVTKDAVYFLAVPCKPGIAASQQQSGIKIPVKAKKGFSAIALKLMVPAGSDVQVIEHKTADADTNSSQQFVCKKSVNCMPMADQAEASPYCSDEYMQWAKKNCDTLPMILE